MFIFSLLFLLGVVSLQFFSTLPSLKWAGLIFALVFLMAKFKIRGRCFFIAFILGFSWCLWSAHTVARFSLTPAWEGKPCWIQGKIASLPKTAALQSSFLFQVDRMQNATQTRRVATFFLLSWPRAKAPRVGDEWRLPVRLKKIHGTLNPGGFDFEAWAFQNGIRAKGFVLEKKGPVLLSHHFLFHPVDQIRQRIQEQARRYLPVSRTSPWLMALMIGERSGIPQEEWEVLRNTGTNHLMAIAGLHIGFMSALAHFFALKFWRRPQWLFLLPAPQAGACASLLIALLYSALAGFSIPTQRALFMLSVFLIAILLRRKIPPWLSWSLALLGVLLLNPLSVLSSSFWLSFITLALLLYGLGGRLSPQGPWWRWGRPQAVLALGLLPLSVWLFMQFSTLSFIANLLAIPWVGFFILPLCLLNAFLLLFFPFLASWTLSLADHSLSLLWSLLTGLAALPWAVWHQAVAHYGYVFAASGGIVLLLLPAGFPGRWLGLFWLLPLFYFHPAKPVRGEAIFTLLDVGQGLSAVIQTKEHVLVFDTGARFSAESDMGEAVVLPFLRAQGIKQVDLLVLSHGDNDHSGGAPALLRQIPVQAIQTSVPFKFTSWPANYCLAGQAWDWDGVHFRFLHPTLTALNFDNDSSCVLQVEAEGKRLLLPGDIEKAAQKMLLSDPLLDLSADLLVAPHHGSKTSGLPEFIARVRPQYVLYAIGYQNRYHFPYPGIVEAYKKIGALQYDTASSGAIQCSIGKNILFINKLYRPRQTRYWNDSN